MQDRDIHKYLQLMEDAKIRIGLIDSILSSTSKFNAPEFAAAELVAVQIRKLLELIAFSSLVANKELYSSSYANFEKAWKAEQLVADLGKINANFYPRPVAEEQYPAEGIRVHIVPLDSGFLSVKSFVSVYKRCGGILHTPNPSKQRPNIKSFLNEAKLWRGQIVNLLRSHVIQLVGSETMYLVHLHEETRGRACHYTISPK